MDIFLGKEREIGIISLISIILCSNGLLFYIQNMTAADLKKTVFEQQKELQIQATNDIARHIGSDINLVMSMLYGLTNSHYIQLGELGSDKTTKLLDDAYNKHNLTIDSLFILDKNNIMVNTISTQPSEFFLGEDFSFRDWVKQQQALRQFSLMAILRDNRYSENSYLIHSESRYGSIYGDDCNIDTYNTIFCTLWKYSRY